MAMQRHLVDEHNAAFTAFANEERRKMKESFQSFLQASMGLGDASSFVLPDGSKADIKPGAMPDLRGHFERMMAGEDEGQELGEMDMLGDLEAMLGGMGGGGGGDMAAMLSMLGGEEGLDPEMMAMLGGMGGMGGGLGGLGGRGG